MDEFYHSKQVTGWGLFWARYARVALIEKLKPQKIYLSEITTSLQEIWKLNTTLYAWFGKSQKSYIFLLFPTLTEGGSTKLKFFTPGSNFGFSSQGKPGWPH